MADLEKVLGSPYKKAADESVKEEESESEPSYDAFADKLGEILGLESDKAHELRDVICGLAKQEMMEEESPEEEKAHEPPKKKGLAIVLGGG